MVDEDSQEGEKKEQFEFDSAGEAEGYISLDQAQVLAMRTARDEHGDYGLSFADVSMAFEVVEAAETEDHYVVTLSFRPEGDFSGVQGREQFYIEKEGAVAIRQVLGLPRRTGRRFPVVRVAVALAAVGVVAAVVAVVAVVAPGGGGDNEVPVAVVAPTNTPIATPTRFPASPTPVPALAAPTASTPAATPTRTPEPPTATATTAPTQTPVVMVVTATPGPYRHTNSNACATNGDTQADAHHSAPAGTRSPSTRACPCSARAPCTDSGACGRGNARPHGYQSPCCHGGETDGRN